MVVVARLGFYVSAIPACTVLSHEDLPGKLSEIDYWPGLLPLS